MVDVSYYLALPYTTVLKRDEDGDVIATIAELDGCIAHGADESDAIRSLRDAQTDWLEAAISARVDIPLPEMEEALPSGKFVVRLPKSLHQRLNKLAKKDDVSLNQVMVMAASEHIARRETHTERQMLRHARAWQFPDTSEWDKRPPRKVEGLEYVSRFRLVTERGVSSSGNETDEHLHQTPKVRRG